MRRQEERNETGWTRGKWKMRKREGGGVENKVKKKEWLKKEDNIGVEDDGSRTDGRRGERKVESEGIREKCL